MRHCLGPCSGSSASVMIFLTEIGWMQKCCACYGSLQLVTDSQHDICPIYNIFELHIDSMWHNKKVINTVSGLNACVASSHRVDRAVACASVEILNARSRRSGISLTRFS